MIPLPVQLVRCHEELPGDVERLLLLDHVEGPGRQALQQRTAGVGRGPFDLAKRHGYRRTDRSGKLDPVEEVHRLHAPHHDKGAYRFTYRLAEHFPTGLDNLPTCG